MDQESEEYKKGMKAIARMLSNKVGELRRIDFSPSKHIDSYLITDFDLRIYNELTNEEHCPGLFDPLEFFNLFYHLERTVLENTDKPSTLIVYLNQLKLDNRQRFFLLRNLSGLLHENYSAQLKLNVDISEKLTTQFRGKLTT